MANGNGVEANKGLQTVIEHRPGDIDTVNRIRPIEYDKAYVVFGSSEHRIAHGRNISIETRADVLDVEYDRIDASEHRGRGAASLTVEAENGNAGCAVSVVVDQRNIELAFDAVLGTENPHESNIVCVVKQPDSTMTVAIQPGVIANQGNAGSCQMPEVVTHEHVNTVQNFSSGRA